MSTRRPLVGRSLKPLRYPRAWCALWCLAIAVVVVASLAPGPQLPSPPGSDKLHHFAGVLQPRLLIDSGTLALPFWYKASWTLIPIPK